MSTFPWETCSKSGLEGAVMEKPSPAYEYCCQPPTAGDVVTNDEGTGLRLRLAVGAVEAGGGDAGLPVVVGEVEAESGGASERNFKESKMRSLSAGTGVSSGPE